MNTTPVKKGWTPPPMMADPTHTVVYPESVRYVELEHLGLDKPNARKAILISAPMGTGKSTCMAKYLNTLPLNSSALVIGVRRTFDKAITAELNQHLHSKALKFTCYLDLKGKAETQACRRLVIQQESLWKLDAVGICFDTVFIDEVKSVLVQSMSVDTNRTMIDNNHRVFERLIRSSRHCFFMDAFLGIETVDLMRSLGMPYTLHKYLRKPVRRRSIRYDTFNNLKDCPNKQDLCKEEFAVFVNKLLVDLRAGIKVYMFCSSFKKSRLILEQIRADSELATLRIRDYNGQIKSDLSNVREDWIKADFVITTATITVGVNYDLVGPGLAFDRVYIYASACSQNLVRDVFQASMRVRHLNHNQLHFFLNSQPRGCEQYLSQALIQERNVLRDQQARDIHLCHQLEWTAKTPLWQKVQDNVNIEANHSGRMFEDMFLYYLNINNYSVETVQKKDACDVSPLIELDEEPFEYADVPEVVWSRILELEKQGSCRDLNVPALTPLEKAIIERHYFDHMKIYSHLPESRRAELWTLYYKELKRGKMKNCQYELGISKGLISTKDILCEGETSTWDTKFIRQITVIEALCQKLDIPHTLLTQTITRIQFEALMQDQEFLQLRDDIRVAFDLFEPKKSVKKEKPITLLAQALNQWSGTKIKAVDKRETMSGVRTRVGDYLFVPLDPDLHKDIRPKASRTSDEFIAVQVAEEQEVKTEGVEI